MRAITVPAPFKTTVEFVYFAAATAILIINTIAVGIDQRFVAGPIGSKAQNVSHFVSNNRVKEPLRNQVVCVSDIKLHEATLCHFPAFCRGAKEWVIGTAPRGLGKCGCSLT